MANWSRPALNVAKVNCKGLFDRSRMRASVGCVMRNHRGKWMKGAAGMIGLAVPLGAELWSIYYGLKLAWEYGVKRVVIESDSLEAVNHVNNPDSSFWFAEMVDMIKMIEGEAWESCDIQHCSADGNRAAHTLATSELDGEDGINELASAPGFMQPILAADRP